MPLSKFLFVLLLAGVSLQHGAAKQAPNPVLFTGKSCNVTEDCTRIKSDDLPEFCNELQKCECSLGWQPSTLPGDICRIKTCTADSECQTLYGPNIHCNYGMCNCGPSTKYNLTERECQVVGNFSKLGGKCETHNDCGSGANCHNEVCKCEVGKKKANDYGCELISCKYYAECEDATPYSVCLPLVRPVNQAGFCSCFDVSLLIENSTACMHTPYRKVGESCLLGQGPTFTCTGGAYCLNGVCKSR